MEQHSLFSSGLELSDLLVNSGLLSCSWDAISDAHRDLCPYDSVLSSVRWKKLSYPPNSIIIAFVSSPQGTISHLQAQGLDLVSSEELKGSFNLFDFLGTQVNRSFAIHRAAVSIFASLLDELTHLRSQLDGPSPLIITGDYLGGSIASLFTLWLLDSMQPATTKRPLCITFGSPLLGDASFQKAMSERPTWNSSFLHVVWNKDIVPHLSMSQTNGMSGGSSRQTCAYMPFGTFLLCSDSGSACFEEPESILQLLMATGSSSVGNPHQQSSLQITDYRPVLKKLMHNSICRVVSSVENSLTNLQAGIMVQLTAIGLGPLEARDWNSLAETVERRIKNFLTGKRYMFDPNKKLTDRKVCMTYLEWYKKMSRDEGGYYDSYKNWESGGRKQIKTRQEIIKRHRILTNYWKRMVSEAEKKPQKEEASFRKRWLYGGTNYRRLVEPLDIADYYQRGNTDYVNRGRSPHYVLLEKWFADDRPVEGGKERNKACSLTEDSCFWAHVEEAIISCRLLKDDQSSSEQKWSSRDSLIGFGSYVMNLVTNFAVSPEVFLPRSSFMQWWEEYCSVIGNLDNSPLADFMRNHYQNYA